MENAEVYMLLLRKTTLAPVLGEAMGHGFWTQIDLDDWSWNLNNPTRIALTKKDDEARAKASTSYKVESLNKKADRLFADKKYKAADAARKQASNMLATSIEDTALDASGRNKNKNKSDDDEDDSNKLKFKFKKRLDAASTQMLNMMKGGIPFQMAMVTVVHRAGVWSKLPGFFSMQFFNLLLTNYDLSVSQDEANTELSEDWEAEYTYVTFEYSRRVEPLRPANALATGLGKMVFVMKPRGLPI